MEGSPAIYTCSACGSHDFTVVHEYTLTKSYVSEIPCDCGGSEDGIASTILSHVTTAFEARGPLDEYHRAGEDETEEGEEIEREDDESDLSCVSCIAENAKDMTVEEEGEVEVEDHEFHVRCADCDREIEFGWSHPDRGGRIWPVESSDFNPWKSWPEERYKDAWAAKGWLRPAGRPA